MNTGPTTFDLIAYGVLTLGTVCTVITMLAKVLAKHLEDDATIRERVERNQQVARQQQGERTAAANRKAAQREHGRWSEYDRHAGDVD